MKMKLTVLGLLATATLTSAQSTNSYSFNPFTPVNVGIPDGNPVGLLEQFTVSGANGAIADVQVNLDITGGFNGDLYAYLVGPQGQIVILLNRPGVAGSNPYGYGDSGMNLTLDGLTANNIHDYGSTSGYSLSGTTWAADGRNVNPESPGDTLYITSTAANLSVFADGNANGVWTFFIADLSVGGGTAMLNNVGLSIMTVPEPQTWVMLGGGLAMLCLCRSWRSFRQ